MTLVKEKNNCEVELVYGSNTIYMYLFLVENDRTSSSL